MKRLKNWSLSKNLSQRTDREISEDEVECAISKGSKELQYPNKILFYYGYFCVVAKKVGNAMFVITVKPR